MSELRYGFEKHLPSTPFDEAVARVTAALKNESFGVVWA